MAAISMALDRLPLESEVVSHYNFFVHYGKETREHTGFKDVSMMVASTVAFVWREASIPCIDVDKIRDRVLTLNRRVVSAFTARPNVDGTHKDQGNAASIFDHLDASGSLSDFIRSAHLGGLFDVLDAEQMEDDDVASPIARAFYEEQKTTRRSRIQSRLGQRCFQGDDFYWAKIRLTNSRFPVLDGLSEGHYEFPKDHLPTQLDVLKYVYSRLLYRKNSHSAGLGYIYTSKENLIYHTSNIIRDIWIARNHDVCSEIMIKKRLQLFLNGLSLSSKGSNLCHIHRSGLGMGLAGRKANISPEKYFVWDNSAYHPFLLDYYDREVFNAFPRGGSNVGLMAIPSDKRKRVAGASDDAHLDQIRIKSRRLTVPDFQEILRSDGPLSQDDWKNLGLVNCENVDSDGAAIDDDAASAGESASNLEEFDQNDAGSSNSVHQSTQTMVHVPLDYDLGDWPHFVDFG